MHGRPPPRFRRPGLPPAALASRPPPVPDALADAALLSAHPFEAAQMGRVLVAVPGADVRLRPATPDAPPAVRLYARTPEAAPDGDAAPNAAPDAARAFADRLGLTVRPDAGTVRVQADARRQHLAAWWPWRLRQTTRLVVTAHLPDGCVADVRTLGGALDARGLRGRHTLEASGGTLTARDLAGRLEVQARGATLDVRGFRGQTLAVDAASAPAHVADAEAETLTLALACCADATLDALRGALSLAAHACRTRLHAPRGPLTATLRGGTLDAALDAALAAPLTVRAAATPVTLALAPPAAAATLALRGAPVTLDARGFEGTRRPGRVHGALGAGGPALTVHAAAAPVVCRVG